MRNVTAEPIILDVSVIVYSRSPSTIKTQLVPRRCYKQCFQVPLIISCILDTVLYDYSGRPNFAGVIECTSN